MKPWISRPQHLKGAIVELLSLQEEHLPALEAIAKHSVIWKHYPFDLSDSRRFHELFRPALKIPEGGSQFPFTIYHKATDSIIGSTRFLDIQPAHRKLEIGFTWLHPQYWGTLVNIECKLLLLTFCFEKLKAVRVQLKTDENNIRSRKAIAKIGGKFEGILRSDMIRDDGTFRNSAYFSIIESEWPACKTNLTGMMQG